jgi:hypothetical protein
MKLKIAYRKMERYGGGGGGPGPLFWKLPDKMSQQRQAPPEDKGGGSEMKAEGETEWCKIKGGCRNRGKGEDKRERDYKSGRQGCIENILNRIDNETTDGWKSFVVGHSILPMFDYNNV